MDSFLIRGGNRLKGKIEISGSKNSALPILAACLMAEGKTTLKSVPRLSDIDSMNAGVAASIALYELARRRGVALTARPAGSS